jgi:hypothetical protein
MADTYTPLLRLTKPGLTTAGWGTLVNNGTFELIDNSIAGIVDVDVSAGNVTLTTASGASDQARYMCLRVINGPVSARNVIVPTLNKIYFVINEGAGPIQIKTATGAAVILLAGERTVVRVDAVSTNVEIAIDRLQSLNLSFALAATSGGTGQSSFAVGDLLYANTTTTLAKLADVATGNVLRSGGVGVAPAWGKADLTTDITGTLPVANGGTGQTTSNAALNALLPSQTSNNNKFLQTDGTNTSWATVDILGTIAAASAGAVGTYALMIPVPNATFAVGDQTAGSNLRFAGTYTDGSGNTGPVLGSAPSGNWRAMGPTNGSYSFTITLWLRYA